jgi:hypothetical protein
MRRGWRRNSRTSSGSAVSVKAALAAQVAEHNDDLSTVVFKDFLVAVSGDGFGQLWREISLQPTHVAQFVYLFARQPCFEATI